MVSLFSKDTDKARANERRRSSLLIPSAAEARSRIMITADKARASEWRTKRVFALPSAAEARVAFSKDTAKVQRRGTGLQAKSRKTLGEYPLNSFLYL